MSVAAAAPRGCSRCETPVEEGDLRCAVCALPVPVVTQVVERARAQILRCTECGAAVAFDANKQAPACGFCGATMKIEQPVDPIEVATRRLPFAVDRALAEDGLRAWLGKRGFFAPSTLRDEAVLETLHPLCWAAWVVDAQARITWTGDSDHGSRRSDWAPHSGEISLTFDNVVVPATRGLRFDECAKLTPHYNLATAVSCDAPRTGLDAEAVIESFDAQRSAARQMVAFGIESAAKSRVQQVIPGTKCRNIHVSCLLERQTTDRVALPAWVLAYRYRGSPYRAVVHGQNPHVVFGSSPIAWGKIFVLVLAGIAVVAVILALLSAR